MRFLRRLKFQVMALVVGISMLSAGVASVLSDRMANDAVVQAMTADAALIARILAESLTLAGEVPQMVEGDMDGDMLATARVLSELVAAVERSKMSREHFERLLKELKDDLNIDEIWISDSKGRVVYSVPPAGEFTFSPNAQLQPQGSRFWPLLIGEAKAVTQEAQPRELDGKVFKYVGVTGRDQPRIVQVGVEGSRVEWVRQRVSVQRLSDLLMQEGLIVQPLVVVDKQLRPSRVEGTADTSLATQNPIGLEDQAGLAQAIEKGAMVLRSTPEWVKLYYPLENQQGGRTVAYMTALSRGVLDRVLARQQQMAMALGAAVLILASLIGWAVSFRLTNRLSLITAVARRMGRGDFNRVDDLVTETAHSDDVAQLGLAVRTMGLEARDREAYLETQVRQRTEELDLRNQALTQAQLLITSELEIARRLQLGILPARFPQVPGWRGAAQIRMQQQMGGDFYDFIERTDGTVALVMADVSGKGIAAAFFMAVARTSLKNHLLAGCAADQALRLTNEELCGNNPLDMFLTVYVAILDPGADIVHWANAGHNPPVLIRTGAAPRLLDEQHGLALGVMPDMGYEVTQTMLHPGDRLLAYTDGVTEAFDEEGQAFGTDRLLQWCAQRHDHEAPAELLSTLFESVDRFAGRAPQSDDITAALLWREPDPTPVEEKP